MTRVATSLEDLCFTPETDHVLLGERDGQPVTRGDFRLGALTWAAQLADRGLQRVALHLADSWEFATALLGAWSQGIDVSVPSHLLPLTQAQLAPHVQAFLSDSVDATDEPHVSRGPLTSSNRPLILSQGQERRIRLFTSGTTGQPVELLKTLRQLSAEVACLEQTFGDAWSDAVVLATVSHHHIYGLLFKVLWPLAAGRQVVWDSLFYPEQIISAWQRHPRCALVSSPAHLKRLPEHLDWPRGGMNAVGSSGGPLEWSAAERSRKLFGTAVTEIYGSSETGGIAWRRRELEREPWRPFYDVQLKVEAESSLLCVRSPKLADEAWFVTADRGRIDDHGGLELLGRADRLVKIEERRISLTAVETALTSDERVAEASVVVLSGERTRLGAVVVLTRQGLALERSQLIRALRKTVANQVEAVGIPHRWRFVEALPLDAQGKAPASALRAIFQPEVDPELLDVSPQGQDSVVLRLRVPGSLHYFKGHFPGVPILPGVVQVHWAQQFGRTHLPIRGEFCGMHAIKFTRPLTPDSVVELKLSYAAESSRLTFRYQGTPHTYSSGTLIFR